MVLPVTELGPDCVLVINATPCLHHPGLPAQTIMLAVNGRLLATAIFPGLRVFGFHVPASIAGADMLELTITHLNYAAPRAGDQYRMEQPLGLMVHSIRVFRVMHKPRSKPPALPTTPEALALCFESIGQGCQFGQIQRQMGADPLNLLRFVDMITSRLVDGLVSGFAGIDAPDRLVLGQSDGTPPSITWRHRDLDVCFDTLIPTGTADPAVVIDGQRRRLTFLRRKFLEDLQTGDKICVLTRSDCLTEPEALAVYSALAMHGPNTLLWTVYGDAATTGRVDELQPGFLCGHLGLTDDVRFAPLEAWLPVLRNAFQLWNQTVR